MKPTKHATTNYRRIAPFCLAARDHDSYRKFYAKVYMPLVVELLYRDNHGRTVYSLCHYGQQNGDAMRDPDMTVALDETAGTVEPLTFQNDYMGVYQEVYTGDGRYRPGLRTSLDDFLSVWSKNLLEQGFNPNQPDPVTLDEFADSYAPIQQA